MLESSTSLKMLISLSVCIFLLLLASLVFSDRKRRLWHIEQLKMIDSGKGDRLLEWLHTRSFYFCIVAVASAIGVLIPAVSFLAAAWVARGIEVTAAVAMTAWICACIASIASVICSLILLFRLGQR